MDEKMLQVEADHLLSAKSVRLFCRHILQIGIIQAAVKAASCFNDDIGQDHPFFLIDLKDTVSEKIHGGIRASKRNNDQIGCDSPRCLYAVEFIGLMEGDFAPFQDKLPIPARDGYLPFIYTHKLPEIMGFPWKFKITHIFKIVNAVELFDRYGIF